MTSVALPGELALRQRFQQTAQPTQKWLEKLGNTSTRPLAVSKLESQILELDENSYPQFLKSLKRRMPSPPVSARAEEARLLLFLSQNAKRLCCKFLSALLKIASQWLCDDHEKVRTEAVKGYCGVSVFVLPVCPEKTTGFLKHLYEMVERTGPGRIGASDALRTLFCVSPPSYVTPKIDSTAQTAVVFQRRQLKQLWQNHLSGFVPHIGATVSSLATAAKTRCRGVESASLLRATCSLCELVEIHDLHTRPDWPESASRDLQHLLAPALRLLSSRTKETAQDYRGPSVRTAPDYRHLVNAVQAVGRICALLPVTAGQWLQLAKESVLQQRYSRFEKVRNAAVEALEAINDALSRSAFAEVDRPEPMDMVGDMSLPPPQAPMKERFLPSSPPRRTAKQRSPEREQRKRRPFSAFAQRQVRQLEKKASSPSRAPLVLQSKSLLATKKQFKYPLHKVCPSFSAVSPAEPSPPDEYGFREHAPKRAPGLAGVDCLPLSCQWSGGQAGEKDFSLDPVSQFRQALELWDAGSTMTALDRILPVRDDMLLLSFLQRTCKSLLVESLPLPTQIRLFRGALRLLQHQKGLPLCLTLIDRALRSGVWQKLSPLLKEDLTEALGAVAVSAGAEGSVMRNDAVRLYAVMCSDALSKGMAIT